ncbi:MAG TPA: hypothetical protein VGL19_16370 [Polyangiaceae bacterium]|jgi:hypothetical protein
MKMQPQTARRRRARAIFRRFRGTPRSPARVYRLVQAELTRSSVGQHLLQMAREEEPSADDRQRILDGVLAALRQLTSGAA